MSEYPSQDYLDLSEESAATTRNDDEVPLAGTVVLPRPRGIVIHNIVILAFHRLVRALLCSGFECLVGLLQ